MTFALYANTVSPHQLPLARELVGRLGAANFRYIYTEPLSQARKAMGWDEPSEPWILRYGTDEAMEWLQDADVVLMQHNRDWNLMEDRLSRGRMCFYSSERWFKPISLYGFVRKGSAKFEIDGKFRMLSPRYRRMANRFLSLARRHEKFKVMCIGVHARSDFLRLGVPEGRLIDWGYFVGNGEHGTESRHADSLRVLWVGSMYELKRVDTIVKACARASKTRVLELTLVGNGPERKRLKRLALKSGIGSRVKFFPSVPIAKVRELMRGNDVFVLASDGQEGWGAVLSEAMEEGMSCLGTFEAGASATVLPKERLFHVGDWRRLSEMLLKNESLPAVDFSKWTVQAAADRLLAVCASK